MYFKWAMTIIASLSLLLFVNISITTIFLTILVAGAIFIVAPMVYNKVSFLTYKRKIKSNDYSQILGRCQMTFSEDGITRKIDGNNTFFAWGQFDKWEEDTFHFFLFENDLQALIIPKQTSEMSEEEKLQYQQWIESSIKLD